MFDIGLMEILLVLIIALLVIGPERMPEVAGKIGQFVGKTKRFINTMKEDSELSNTVREIKESINFEEERKQIQEIRHDLNNDLSAASQDLDLSEFQRPFAGQPAESAHSSQFNKAPSQPASPQPVSAAAETGVVTKADSVAPPKNNAEKAFESSKVEQIISPETIAVKS